MSQQPTTEQSASNWQSSVDHLSEAYRNGLLVGAAFIGRQDIVDYLVQRYKSDVNRRNHMGEFYALAALNALQLSDAAINSLSVAYPNVSKEELATRREIAVQYPLQAALFAEQWDMAHHLISDLKANVNAILSDHDDTLLNFFALRNKADAVRLPLEEGADLRLTDDVGNTPLHRACWTAAVETAQVLLEFGADPQAQAGIALDYSTPLDTAKRALFVSEERRQQLIDLLNQYIQAQDTGVAVSSQTTETSSASGTAAPATSSSSSNDNTGNASNAAATTSANTNVTGGDSRRRRKSNARRVRKSGGGGSNKRTRSSGRRRNS